MVYKKILKKNQLKKIVLEKVNQKKFLTKPKKKKQSRNTTKYHNTFTIPLFSTMVDLNLIFYYLILTYKELTPQQYENIVITTKCYDIFMIQYLHF